MQVSPHVYQLHIDEDPENFGAMHPGGSNIYFVGDPAESMVVIDTGEHYRDWTNSILDYYAGLGRPTIGNILITHGHGDHIGGVDRVQEAMDCPVRCHPKLERRLSRILSPGVIVPLDSQEAVSTGGGAVLTALFTPGHEEDHVSYYLASDDVMFTGDTVLGGSTSTMRELGDYMQSLELLASYAPARVFPAHGPLVDSGTERIKSYIKHRQEREEQILAALGEGLSDVYDIVEYVYPRDLPRRLREAAARNVRTHLAKLVQEERATEVPARYGAGSR